MTQAINKEEIILGKIKNSTPKQQQEVLDFIEFLEFKLQKQKKQKAGKKMISAYETAKEFAGCVDGGSGDLATKFGKNK